MTRAPAFPAPWLPAIVVVAGCTSVDPVAPEYPVADPAVIAFAQAPAGDVDGMWNWSRLIQLTAPVWVAQQIFGIQPEGPVTHFRCSSTGTMHLDQVDGALSGTADVDAVVCETRGGQVFGRPVRDVPLSGRLHGSSLEFLWDETDVVCQNHATITDATAGQASHLRGTGRCIVPGHPASPIPLDPPPAGTSKVLSFNAWR